MVIFQPGASSAKYRFHMPHPNVRNMKKNPAKINAIFGNRNLLNKTLINYLSLATGQLGSLPRYGSLFNTDPQAQASGTI
jgi:hypothetical protein